MSTAGSTPSDGGVSSPARGGPAVTTPAKPPRARRRALRWQGLVAFALLLVALAAGWTLLGDRLVESTAEEAATKLLGATVEIDGLRIHTAATSLDVGAVRIADPFDPLRNLVDARDLVLVLEPEPLLEKKLVVRRLVLGDVRFGTRRDSPAPAAPRDGFAAKTLGEMKRWAGQFQRPLLSFTPIDTVKQLVLDPTQLATVREAQVLAAHADSIKDALDGAFRGLALQATLDSVRALLARLEGADPRTLGLDGTRRAVADVRRTLDEVSAAKRRVESLATSARAGARALDGGLRDLDSVRRADYAFARSLLQVPTIEGPALGNALFGDVSIDRFQRAVYWAELAQQYMPPGLAPRDSTRRFAPFTSSSVRRTSATARRVPSSPSVLGSAPSRRATRARSSSAAIPRSCARSSPTSSTTPSSTRAPTCA